MNLDQHHTDLFQNLHQTKLLNIWVTEKQTSILRSNTNLYYIIKEQTFQPPLKLCHIFEMSILAPGISYLWP